MTIHDHERRHTHAQVGPIRQLLIQPTSYCNLDCRYCYLSKVQRAQRNEASLTTVKRAFEFVHESGLKHSRLEIRWHAGEPLTRGLRFYRDAYHLALHTFGLGAFWFSIQTNGVAINDDWCMFFKEIDAEVGVSIDGPKRFHDRNRVVRSEQGTFDRVIRGIERLNLYDVPFDAICVASEDLLSEPDETHQFFSELGCREVGFNTDDFVPYTEPALKTYRSFFARLLELSKCGGPVIRELSYMRQAIDSPIHPIGNTMTHPLAILSVDSRGNWTTFSPELLTAMVGKSVSHIIGNVFDGDLRSAISMKTFRRLADSVAQGVLRCRDECPFFSVCGGGSPSAKLIERGTLAATETSYCRTRIKQVAHVLLADLEANAVGG